MQFLSLLLALLLLPAAIIMLWERIVFAQVPRAWSVYKVTGIIGTPLHEIAHATACILFGLRITAMSLYSPDASTGRMGYVHFMYRPGSTWHQVGCMVQGVAPLIMGGTIVSLVLDGGFLAPMPAAEGQFFNWLWMAGWETLNSAWIFAQHSIAHAAVILLLTVIGMHAIPSVQDVRVGLSGFLVVLIPLVLVIAAIHFAPEFGLENRTVERIALAMNALMMSWMWWLLYAACSVVTLAVAGSLVFVLVPALGIRLLRGNTVTDDAEEPSEGNPSQ